jgi:hypothetical protein
MGDQNPSASADLSREDELSREWRDEGLRYVTATNEYVKRGYESGWENAGEEPEDTRTRLGAAVIDAVRRANGDGRLQDLRDRFPPAHAPLLDLLQENGQTLPLVLLLDDGRIILRIGAPHQQGHVVMIDDIEITDLGDNIITVGRSPNRRYFAVARPTGITVHDGWDGPRVASFSWPTGREGAAEGFASAAFAEFPPIVSELIPFPDADRVLLVSPAGIFVLALDGATRLLPTREDLTEGFEWLRENRPNEPLTCHIDMEHGAISHDGRWIAAGHQSSMHFVFDGKTLQVVGEIGNKSEYPHFAAFSADDSILALNSCHFYWGVTLGVPTHLLPGIKTEQFQDDPRVRVLQDGARVYAAVFRGDEFIVGDASGYLIAFDTNGNRRWEHFLGSSIGDIDVSRDGKRLIATSYAGFLSIIDLDTGEKDPFTIGTATHKERRRLEKRTSAAALVTHSHRSTGPALPSSRPAG